MDYADVRAQLRKMVKELGTQRAVAEKLGIGRQYLSDVLSGKRDPGPAVLNALGLKATTVIVEKGDAA